MDEGPGWYATKSLGEREATRTGRLLDAKHRTIGMDVAGLAHQEAEKALAKATAAEEKAAADAAVLTAAAAATALEHEAAARRKALTSGVVGEWGTQRDKTLRREWDLSDPARVKKTPIPRNTGLLYETHDAGHVSNAQTFEAEWRDDPSIPAHKRAALLRSLAAGVDESRARVEVAAATRRLDEEAALTRDAAAVAVEAEAAALRAALRASFTAENAALASTRAAAAAAVKASASAVTVSHVAKEEANPFLREDTRMAASALGPHRVRPDHFKGLPKAAVAGVYAELDAVAAATRSLKAEAAATAAAEDAVILAQAAAAKAVEEAAEEERRARAKAYYAELAADAEARRQRQAAARDADRVRCFPADSGLLSGFGKSLR